MKKKILFIITMVVMSMNIMAQRADPCETLAVFVDAINSQLPIDVGDISTFKSINIDGGYVVQVTIMHSSSTFNYGKAYPSSYKRQLMKNYASNELLVNQTIRILACGKQLKDIIRNDNGESFTIVYTTDDLRKIVNGDI